MASFNPEQIMHERTLDQLLDYHIIRRLLSIQQLQTHIDDRQLNLQPPPQIQLALQQLQTQQQQHPSRYEQQLHYLNQLQYHRRYEHKFVKLFIKIN